MNHFEQWNGTEIRKRGRPRKRQVSRDQPLSPLEQWDELQIRKCANKQQVEMPHSQPIMNLLDHWNGTQMRKRGRPRKVRVSQSQPVTNLIGQCSQTLTRRRGRPRKYPVPTSHCLIHMEEKKVADAATQTCESLNATILPCHCHDIGLFNPEQQEHFSPFLLMESKVSPFVQLQWTEPSFRT
ncbi:hypothetical protein AB6A40_004730 [Gnathostoma spinigerum]|uniref:Uncharacterized protein n=1 Tax=Gnathostoma spinigerum TaxID=75299 RepID=A0ABD6EEE4_9BILA